MKESILLTAILGAVAAVPLAMILQKLRRVFPVPEGYVGLLYREGKFLELLVPGRHVRWGRHFTLGVQDIRKTILSVTGQEVLTADSVSLKLNLAVTYHVADPAKAAHETQYWQADLHNAAQLALRAVAGSMTIETWLGPRPNLSAGLLALLQPEMAKIGITIHQAEVKDVMLPAELKRAFADVHKAKQEGQAALERARGESAALRNLANAARLLDGNPALQNLRLMQSLTSAQNAGHTLVMGVSGGFLPLPPQGKPAGDQAGTPET